MTPEDFERYAPVGEANGSKPILPQPVPGRADSEAHLLTWVTRACRLEHNPIVSAHRYGQDTSSLIVLKTAGGEKLRLPHKALMGANGLRHTLLAFDGTPLPRYSAAQCEEIVARVVWASKMDVQDDELETLIDDVSPFLGHALRVNGLLRGSYDRERGYQLLADFVALNQDIPEGELPVLALDDGARPASLWVPRGPLIAHLRHLWHQAHPPTVRTALEQIGWVWRNLQRRAPGPGAERPVARVYTMPVAWEPCPFDLAEAVTKAKDAHPKKRSWR